MQDFPLVFLLAFVLGAASGDLGTLAPSLPLSNSPSPSEVPAQGVGSSLKLHEATPSRAWLHLGLPRLTATLRVGACALLLASFALICLAAQFPTSTGFSPPRLVVSAPLEKVWFLLTVGVSPEEPLAGLDTRGAGRGRGEVLSPQSSLSLLRIHPGLPAFRPEEICPSHHLVPRWWVGAWEGNNPALNPRPLDLTHQGAHNSSRQEGQRRSVLPADLQADEAKAKG